MKVGLGSDMVGLGVDQIVAGLIGTVRADWMIVRSCWTLALLSLSSRSYSLLDQYSDVLIWASVVPEDVPFRTHASSRRIVCNQLVSMSVLSASISIANRSLLVQPALSFMLSYSLDRSNGTVLILPALYRFGTPVNNRGGGS